MGAHTPAGIRASARREVSMAQQSSSREFGLMQQKQSEMAKVRTQSIHGLGLTEGEQQPRAVEQVAYLLKQLQKDKDKVFVPLDSYVAAVKATTKPGVVLHESRQPDRVLPGNLVFSQNGFVKLGSNRKATTDFISKEDYI